MKRHDATVISLKEVRERLTAITSNLLVHALSKLTPQDKQYSVNCGSQTAFDIYFWRREPRGALFTIALPRGAAVPTEQIPEQCLILNGWLSDFVMRQELFAYLQNRR